MINFDDFQIDVLSKTVAATIDVGACDNWPEYKIQLERRGYCVTHERGNIWAVRKTRRG